MALFRVMRVDGVAIFTNSAPVPSGETPDGSGWMFLPNRLAGVALFRALRLESDSEHVGVNYDETLQVGLLFDFDGEEGNVFSEFLTASMVMGFAHDSATRGAEQVLDAMMAIDMAIPTSASIQDTLTASFKTEVDLRGRVAGWESDRPHGPPTWVPQPKPKLY